MAFYIHLGPRHTLLGHDPAQGRARFQAADGGGGMSRAEGFGPRKGVGITASLILPAVSSGQEDINGFF